MRRLNGAIRTYGFPLDLSFSGRTIQLSPIEHRHFKIDFQFHCPSTFSTTGTWTLVQSSKSIECVLLPASQELARQCSPRFCSPTPCRLVMNLSKCLVTSPKHGQHFAQMICKCFSTMTFWVNCPSPNDSARTKTPDSLHSSRKCLPSNRNC